MSPVRSRWVYFWGSNSCSSILWELKCAAIKCRLFELRRHLLASPLCYCQVVGWISPSRRPITAPSRPRRPIANRLCCHMPLIPQLQSHPLSHVVNIQRLQCADMSSYQHWAHTHTHAHAQWEIRKNTLLVSFWYIEEKTTDLLRTLWNSKLFSGFASSGFVVFECRESFLLPEATIWIFLLINSKLMGRASLKAS